MNVGKTRQDTPSPQKAPPPPLTCPNASLTTFHAQRRICKKSVSKGTPPLPVRAQSESTAPSFPWLSVLFLLVEREEEQGYTGRHINGACHAPWSSYAWRRMSACKVLSSNRISASATSLLGDIPPCSATFLENDLLLSKWSAAGPTVNPSTLSWCALGYRTMLPQSFLRLFIYLFFATYCRNNSRHLNDQPFALNSPLI